MNSTGSDDYLNDERVKTRLLSFLRNGESILFVGSGSSKLADYPLWDELLNALRAYFAPDIPMPEGNYDRLKFAEFIKQRAFREKSRTEYCKFLERQFDPKHVGKTHDEFHTVLVNFKFKGIVTTNYDIVLESAITEKQINNEELYRSCDPVDLCDWDKSYRVSDYLRSLSSANNCTSVLHLHGFYKNPENLILTERDYLLRYGYIDSNDSKTPVPIDTLHRKVIWSLLAMHSVIFVGFSMKDPFFTEILEVVRNDLNLDGDLLHFAILPEDDRDKAQLLSNKYCVQSIFYPVQKTGMLGEEKDYSGVKNIIYEIANSSGIAIGSPKLSSITQRMLER
jgi:hypothetical protein